jgi:hypothetical protein
MSTQQIILELLGELWVASAAFALVCFAVAQYQEIKGDK